MKKYFAYCILLFAGIFSANEKCFAQVDSADGVKVKIDTINMLPNVPHIPIVYPYVSITDYRLRFLYPGMINQPVDSLTKSHNEAGSIADIFTSQGTFLKSYGSGELSTTAIRGASGSQTAVLWNGIDLRSTTNGFADLSIIPSILFSDVSISNGAFVNSIGGQINLTGFPQFSGGGKNIHVKIAEQMGSFGKVNNGLRMEFRSEKSALAISVYDQHATNNFTYRDVNRADEPLDTLKNAHVGSKGIAADARLRIKGSYNFLNVHSWFSDSYREIPATMLETVSEQTQTDRFFRNSAEFDHYTDHFHFYLRSSLLTEYLLFVPGFTFDNSTTNSLAILNNAGLSFDHKNLNVAVDAGHTWTQAEVSEYMPRTSQNRYFASANAEYVFKNNLNVSLLIRDEFLETKAEPVTGSLGAAWYLKGYFTLHFTISRKYRLPTFNDLYWHPGGNPDLKPEDSRNVDGGIDFDLQKNNFHLRYSLNGYYRYVYNWIQWQPGPGYWVPKNLYEVQSYGSENRLKIEWKKNKWDDFFLGGLDYVRATNEKAIITGDSSIGKQLMYLPAYSMNAMFHFAYDGYYLELQDNFTGLRFTATDHSTSLPSYNIINVTIGKRLAILGENSDLFFRCNNISGLEYQAISWRPMPGRNFEVGLTLNFSQPIKSKTN